MNQAALVGLNILRTVQTGTRIQGKGTGGKGAFIVDVKEEGNIRQGLINAVNIP